MSASSLIAPSRLRALAGTVATLLLLGAIALAGAVAVVTALLLGAGVTGGIFVWSKISAHRMRAPRPPLH